MSSPKPTPAASPGSSSRPSTATSSPAPASPGNGHQLTNRPLRGQGDTFHPVQVGPVLGQLCLLTQEFRAVGSVDLRGVELARGPFEVVDGPSGPGERTGGERDGRPTEAPQAVRTRTAGAPVGREPLLARPGTRCSWPPFGAGRGRSGTQIGRRPTGAPWPRRCASDAHTCRPRPIRSGVRRPGRNRWGAGRARRRRCRPARRR